jgi:hypothetical protein
VRGLDSSFNIIGYAFVNIPQEVLPSALA